MWQAGGNHPSSILLEGTPAAVANEASPFRKGGKRPRATSSIFAAAAAGMLTGRVAPTAVVTAPSFAKQNYAHRHEQQPEALFRLRGHMGSGRVSPSAAKDSLSGSPDKRIIPSGSTVANTAITTTAVFQSNAADAMMLDESSYREDALGEAAAMAADERRSSPPAAPAPERSMAYNRKEGRKGRAHSPQPTLTDDAPETAWSQAIPFDSRTPKDDDDGLVETEALASSSVFIDTHRHESSSPTAPAYEPSPFNEGKAAADASWRYNPANNLEGIARGRREETQQQRDGSAGARAKGGDLELARANGFSSRIARLSSQRQGAGKSVQVDVEGDGRQHTKSSQQRVPAVSNLEGEEPPSPTVNRQDFLSTMKKSDDAYQSVREDLLHYMEGVRARWADPRFREILLLEYQTAPWSLNTK